ncbi:MAG: hypothetical protein P8049_07230 [Gemmatimonadota bacterium]|jgi:hypothetical protein
MIRRRVGFRTIVLLVAVAISGCASTKPPEEGLPPAGGSSTPRSPIAGGDTLRPPSEQELYGAAVAAGAPDAVPRDTRRARALLDQLLELYPETEHAPDVALFRAFLDREEELSRQLRVLESELEQLKAIDFGEPADPARP